MGTTVHAFGDDALGDLDAVGVARAVRSGSVSAAEVRDAAVARAEKMDPELCAIVARSFEGSVPVRRGVFTGVPTFVKDNNIVAGFPTLQGSEVLKAVPAKKNGPVPERLLSMGMTILGKSAMPEFGLNASTEHMTAPPTRNPWDTDRSAGGSSGGAAALVASGVVPLAHGNDGGGSIRIPAACNGLVGLKPTRGRFVLGATEKLLPVQIVSEGILSRSVRDTAHFWAVADGWSSRKLPAIGLVDGPGRRRLRVGLVRESLGDRAIDADTERALDETAELLTHAGHTVVSTGTTIDPRFADDFLIYWSMLAFVLKKTSPTAAGSDSNDFDTVTTGLAARYRANMSQTVPVIRRLRKSQQDYARMFERFDVVLSPVLSHVTPEIGYLSPRQPAQEVLSRLERWVAFTPLHNTAGAPSMSLPLAQTADGLPIGMMLSSAHGDERTLLELAYELELAKPWPTIAHRRDSTTTADDRA